MGRLAQTGQCRPCEPSTAGYPPSRARRTRARARLGLNRLRLRLRRRRAAPYPSGVTSGQVAAEVLEPRVLLSAGYPLPLALMSAGYPLLGQGELLRGELSLRLQLLEQCGVVPGEDQGEGKD